MLAHLDHDSGALQATLEFDAAGRPRLDTHGIEPVYQQLHSGHYFVIRVDNAHSLHSASLGGFALPTAPIRVGEKFDYHAQGPAGQPVLVFARSEKVAGHELTLFVAEDLSETNREIWQLSLASLAIFIPLLGAAVWMQRLAVQRALQPLAGVRDQLREVGAGKNAQISGDVPQEIKPLVDEVNRLLVLLQRRLNQSRTALGNLAHALKTPLAVLFRSAEDPAAPPQVQQVLREQAGAIRDRVERELRRARLAGTPGAGAGAYFNPTSDLPVLTRVLAGVYREKEIDFNLSMPDILLPFDREDMLELIGNLADNACKWAAARVAIAITAPVTGGDAQLGITVADDGPGCSPEEMQEILKRGVRLDEAKAGHGLGLNIATDIVDFYGGRLDVDRDPQLGGLRVSITLAQPSSAQQAP